MHDFEVGCKHIPGQTALQIFIQITVPGKSSIEYSQIICSVLVNPSNSEYIIVDYFELFVGLTKVIL